MSKRGGLVAHDAAIVWAMLRSLGRNRSDLITLFFGGLLLALFGHGWTAHLLPAQLGWLAGGAGVAIGFIATALAIERIAYHRSDGVLAAAAHGVGAPLRLIAVYLGAALMIGGIGLLIMGDLVPGWYAAGFTAGGLSGAVMRPIRQTGARWRDRLAHRLSRKDMPSATTHWLPLIAGTLCGGVLAVLPVEPLVTVALVVLIAIGVIAAFGSVDADVVAYRTMMGNTARAIILDRITRPLAFLVPMTAALAVRPNGLALPAAALFTGTAPILIALRVLAYRALGRRAGDWFITILLAAAALALFQFPPLAPVVLMAGLFRLARTAALKRWLIA